MNATFSEIWSDVEALLRPGDLIRNWSVDRGYTGGQFEILEVLPDAIVVAAEETDRPRRIGRNEFEKIFAHWPGYCARRPDAARSKMRSKSVNLTYISSLFRWQEEQKSRRA